MNVQRKVTDTVKSIYLKIFDVWCKQNSYRNNWLTIPKDYQTVIRIHPHLRFKGCENCIHFDSVMLADT